MNITKDDVLNHLRANFDVNGGEEVDGYGHEAWDRAEQMEKTYFTAPGSDGVVRDNFGSPVELDATLSDAGVTWRFQQITKRPCDESSENRFSKITEFTLPGGEVFFVGASFTSDSWDAGNNYSITSFSLEEVQRREKVAYYFE